VPARSDTVALVAIATGVAAVDQLTKIVVRSVIGPGRSGSRVDLVDGWLALEYTENRGAAFGMLSGLGPVLAAASIAILAGLVLLYTRHERPPLWHTVAIGAVAGGALGNLVDRLWLGYVIDFVSVGPWPNFNIADSAITVGVLILIWGWTRPAATFDLARVIDQKG
jgi:signal peptidase II